MVETATNQHKTPTPVLLDHHQAAIVACGAAHHHVDERCESIQLDVSSCPFALGCVTSTNGGQRNGSTVAAVLDHPA